MQEIAADRRTAWQTSAPPVFSATHSRFAIFAWGVLAYNIAVILWGALVRATGSGAGCGGHWPLCNGDLLPQLAQSATIIELTHRVMSGIALLSVAALWAWALRAWPRQHPARRWATWSVVFILTEALLGAALVLLGHVAKNESTGRLYSLSAHLVNTFLLLASLALTASTASIPGTSQRVSRKFQPRAAVALVALVIVAIAGAITALGDTLFPAHSLAAGMRDDFASTASFLVRLRVIHPALAIAAAGFLGWFALPEFRSGRTPSLKWLSGGVIVLAACEVLAGAANILLRAPLAMQLTHLLIADCLWIVLVLLVAERGRNWKRS